MNKHQKQIRNSASGVKMTPSEWEFATDDYKELRKESKMKVATPFKEYRTIISEKSKSFGVICMECGKRFKTSSTIPSCPKCKGSDIELDEDNLDEKGDLMKKAGYAGSRHKKIERDKYNKKRRGFGIQDEKEIEEGTVLAITDVDQWTTEIYKGLKTGWKSVAKSTLGGDENVAIMIKVTIQPEKDWPNKILQNADFGMVRIATNGTMEMFASGHKVKNMRKTKIKSAKDVVNKINKWADTVSEEVIDEGKSAYEKEIAAFLKKGGKIKKLAVSKKEVAKAAAEFRKSHKAMTQKEIELDLEDEIEAQQAESRAYLNRRDDDEKKKKKKGGITPMSQKKVRHGQSGYGSEDVDEATKILKPGTKVKVAHPAKGKGMVTGTIVRYDKGGPHSPFYVVDIGERMSEKVPAHKIKEDVDITEAVDENEVLELKIFIENEPRFEKQRIIPIVKNIQRKMAKGDYDHKKAPKLWLYLVKDAVKLFAKEFGTKIDTAVQKEVAQRLADDYRDEIEAQDGKMYENTSFRSGGPPIEDSVIEALWEEEDLLEVLKSKDKSVIDAFYDKKPLEGRMLNTDGVSLEKTGMGGQEIAHWEKGKIKITAVSDVKSTESILKYMRASIPKANFEGRNYRKEYDNYHSSKEQIARRSSRNQARRIMGDKTEEDKDVGHKDNNPLNNDPKNLRNEDPSKNRREPRLRKMESFASFTTESTRNDIHNGSISAGVELEKYAKKSGGIDKDDMLATAAILKKGKLPSAKQIPGDTDPRDKVFSIIGKHLSKQYLKKYKGLSPALDNAMKEQWQLDERTLTDTELKRREEIAQELDDDKFKKRYGDDWKSVKMGVATNMAKKESFSPTQYKFFEASYKYKTSHKTYTSAVEEALLVADKQGYEVDENDYFNQIATGPRKPGEGKTNRFQIALQKGGKEQKKRLQIQIYGKGKHGYELNCYIQ